MKANQTVPISKQSLPTRGIQNCASQWSTEKTERDVSLWGNEQRLWVVQNRVYDLTKYVKSHPGGQHWLSMTKGQDITEHFISHHLNQQKARLVLDKYYVGEAKIQQASRFQFKKDGLYRRVKERLLEKFSQQELQDTSKSVIDGVIFIIIWLVLFVMTGVFQSVYWAILCGCLIFPLAGVAHNFVHMKNHPFRFLWLFTGFTHQEWQQMHCLSHHSYANTLIDYEIQAVEPIIYYLRILPQNSSYFWVIKEAILMMLTPINILIKLVIRPITQLVQPQWFYLVPLMQLPILWGFTGDLSEAFKLFMVIHMSFSFVFSKLSFIGHRTGFEWTEGNQEIKDFGEHHIYASTNIATQGLKGFWSYCLYAGFNYHSVHHLFPTINNHRLPEASAILQQEAQKLGMKLNFVKGAFQGLLEIERSYFNRREWKKCV